MFHNKPVIGIAGGIGGGKTHIAKLFGELGCFIIHSDDQVRDAYNDPAVQDAIRTWWGDDVFRADNTVNRSAIAALVFNDPAERRRLEQLLHPWVNDARERAMSAVADDPQVLAFIWDTPLLFETALNRQCDAVVYVETPAQARLQRLTATRGWDAGELARREKSQWALDKKREMSDYVLVNTADADDAVRSQVREILSRILAK
ncbi:MAG TPA: dephospho-CoA kinase [Tepidisphaeraceae bacterium]|nr:dephospho-CoA kinase [Tepidisphaeraceae bacterium]